jgi:hypothetical protein
VFEGGWSGVPGLVWCAEIGLACRSGNWSGVRRLVWCAEVGLLCGGWSVVRRLVCCAEVGLVCGNWRITFVDSATVFPYFPFGKLDLR